MGADVITSKFIPPPNPWDTPYAGLLSTSNYQLNLINLWRGDNWLGQDLSNGAGLNPLFDARNIKCCDEETQWPFHFDCNNLPVDFGVYLRSEPKYTDSLWFTNQHRERLMSEITGGINLCATTFNRAATDEVLRSLANAIQAHSNRDTMWEYVLDAFSFALVFLAPEAALFEYFFAEGLEEVATLSVESLVKKGLPAVVVESLIVIPQNIKNSMTVPEVEAINEGLNLIDWIMDIVFRHSKALISQLNKLDNHGLSMYKGMLLGDKSPCSLSNVTSLLNYTQQMVEQGHSCWGCENNLGMQGNYINFRGLCQKDNEWYFAYWKLIYVRPGFGCELERGPVLQSKLRDTARDVVGQKFAIGQAKTNFTKFSLYDCDANWPSDVECYYNEIDWRGSSGIGYEYWACDPYNPSCDYDGGNN